MSQRHEPTEFSLLELSTSLEYGIGRPLHLNRPPPRSS
jgi:hypothetical protein